MEAYQFWALMGMMAAGFGWLIHQSRDLDKRMTALEIRLTIVETILSMMGMPIKEKK